MTPGGRGACALPTTAAVVGEHQGRQGRGLLKQPGVAARGHRDTGPGVGHEGRYVWSEEHGGHRHGNGADAHGGEEGGREGQLVADHHEHPLTGLDAEGAQAVGGHPGSPLQLGIGLGLLAAPVGNGLALAVLHVAVDQPSGRVEAGLAGDGRGHQTRTYSKSTGLAWTPLAGGATQLAMRPGS